MTELAIDPFEYQLDDMRYLVQRKKGALLHDPGVGKTFGAILALSYVLETEGGIAIVVMPPILINTWYDKIYEYLITDLKTLKYVGSPKDREKLNLGDYNIILISYQLLSRDFKRFKRLTNLISLTIDESKFIKFGEVKKSKKTQRMNGFGTVQSLVHKAKYVTIMNGTPLTKSPLDAFHIIQLLNPGIYVTKKNFLRVHGVYIKSDIGFPMLSGWKFLPALESRLAQVSRRLIKSEVLKDLPAKQLIIKQFDLDPKHQENLKELWDFGYLYLQQSLEQEALFLEGIALLMRVRQAMIQPALVGCTGESSYIKVLEDLLDDLGTEQVIIFAHFHNTIDIINDLLNKKHLSYVELHGRISAKAKDKAVMSFKTKKVQVLVANPKSAGVGLDFQQAHNAIYLELDHDVDGFWQGQDRLHRPGQTCEVNIFVLLARNTPAVALFRGIKTNVDYVAQVLKGREDSSVFFDNKITTKEELLWETI